MTELRIDQIKVGKRYRKEQGGIATRNLDDAAHRFCVRGTARSTQVLAHGILLHADFVADSRRILCTENSL